jgi:hypothetical protein
MPRQRTDAVFRITLETRPVSGGGKSVLYWTPSNIFQMSAKPAIGSKSDRRLTGDSPDSWEPTGITRLPGPSSPVDPVILRPAPGQPPECWLVSEIVCL